MSHICSRCRAVFYSNAEYRNHRCGVELVPRDASKGKEEAAQAETPKAFIESTKGLPIRKRLEVLLPLPHDRTPLIHESATEFQYAAEYLTTKTMTDDGVRLVAPDVRALVHGLHCLCDRIEALQRGASRAS